MTKHRKHAPKPSAAQRREREFFWERGNYATPSAPAAIPPRWAELDEDDE